jgi:hypothetical protein
MIDIIMLCIYLTLWFILVGLGYLFLYMVRSRHTLSVTMLDAHRIVMIILNLLFITGLFLVIFYSPVKTEYDKDIQSAQDQYLKYKKDVEDVYADQLKTTWMNAMNGKNKYFIIVFMVLCYLPVPYYLVYLLYHNPNEPTPLDHFLNHQIIPFSILSFSLISLITTFTCMIMYGISMYYVFSAVVLCALSAFYVFFIMN